MGDHDIHAFALPPMRNSAAGAPASSGHFKRRQRRIWPWVLATLLLLSTVALVAALMAAAATAHRVAAGDTGFENVQITVDGEPWDLNHGDHSHAATAALAVGAAVGMLTLLALLVMPLALLVVLVAAAVAVGFALMALAAVLGVTFSPLWLLLLLAWLLFRPRST